MDVSPSDKRHYEAIELPNGLRALLIHDPEIESFDQMRSRAEEERNGCSCSGHAMHGTQTDHCDDCDDIHVRLDKLNFDDGSVDDGCFIVGDCFLTSVRLLSGL